MFSSVYPCDVRNVSQSSLLNTVLQIKQTKHSFRLYVLLQPPSRQALSKKCVFSQACDFNRVPILFTSPVALLFAQKSEPTITIEK